MITLRHGVCNGRAAYVRAAIGSHRLAAIHDYDYAGIIRIFRADSPTRRSRHKRPGKRRPVITCVITNPATGDCDAPSKHDNDLSIVGAAGVILLCGNFQPYPLTGRSIT